MSVTCVGAFLGAKAHAHACRACLERVHRREHVARVAEGGGARVALLPVEVEVLGAAPREAKGHSASRRA